MRFPFSTIRSLGTLAIAATALVACSDDSTDPPPAAPGSVTATELPSGDVEVSWSAVAGADAYRIERSEDGGAFAQLAGDVDETEYVDADVEPSVQYSYRVYSVRGSTLSGPSGTATLTTGEAVRTITGNITADQTWYGDTVYTISGFVKVTDGATLTIQPGTRIVGDYGTPGSSLWILRGARIEANGTADAPVVFTSSRPDGQRNAGDWGGIVIVGNGVINRTGAILTEGPQEHAQNYGQGTDNADDSGHLTYVRIEFAGYDISGGAGQELNSLSSYAVGSGTTYDHVQTMYGLDDAFEWWGGAVDGRYLVSYETGDDHFDASEGYIGRNQYMIALQTVLQDPEPSRGGVGSDPRGIEVDGCDVGAGGCSLGYASEPVTMPVFANFTVIGPGPGVFTATDGNGMVIRRGAGGTYINGVVGRWPGVGLQLRDARTEELRTLDSLIVRNVVFAENAGGAYTATNTTTERYGAEFGAAGYENRTAADAEALFTGLPAAGTAPTAAGLDWTPAVGSALRTSGSGAFPALGAARVESFFGTSPMSATDFSGAADPDATTKWWAGWTTYARN